MTGVWKSFEEFFTGFTPEQIKAKQKRLTEEEAKKVSERNMRYRDVSVKGRKKRRKK